VEQNQESKQIKEQLQKKRFVGWNVTTKKSLIQIRLMTSSIDIINEFNEEVMEKTINQEISD